MILKTTVRKNKHGHAELIIPIEQIKQAMLDRGYVFLKVPKKMANENTAQFLAKLLHDGYRAGSRRTRS